MKSSKLPLIALALFLLPLASAAEVTVSSWYPKGLDYVFVCSADGFTPTSYDWDFGDGEKLYDRAVSDVYHRYAENGQYTVVCAAADDSGHYQLGTVEVTAVRHDADVRVKDWYPQGMDYVFVCSSEDFKGASFDWDFGDGEKLYDMKEDNVFHTFKGPGTYKVTCSVNGEYGEFQTGTLKVSPATTEVPEFGLVAAGLVMIAGIGLVIARRK